MNLFHNKSLIINNRIILRMKFAEPKKRTTQI